MEERVQAMVVELLAGRKPDAAVAEGLKHSLGDLERGEETFRNTLNAALADGELTGPVIALLEHLAPGAAARLLHHYRHRTGRGRALGFVTVVTSLNATVPRCGECKRLRRKDRARPAFVPLDVEEFRASVEAAHARHVRAAQAEPPTWSLPAPPDRRLTLVTGVSGLALDRALATLATGPRGERAVVNVDAHFCVLTDHFLTRLGFYDMWREQPALQRAFRLNAHILQDCWRLAFRSAVWRAPTGIDEVDDRLRGLASVIDEIPHRDVVLSCHVTWYDVLAHGFLVAADVRELAALAAPELSKRVVVFVDDIYDICARLIRTGMYDHLARGERVTLLDDLLRIVEWRRAEVLVSEVASRALGADVLIVPMKLPIATVNRLIDGPREDVVYLSYSAGHPFRPMVLPHEREPWQRFVIDTSRALTARTDLAVVDATAVDEYRIQRHDSTLRPRWPYHPADVLAVALDGEERVFAEDPFARRDDSPQDRATLRRHLFDLVQARGRALARQAGALVLLRPFATDGGFAEGMDIVSDQNRRLVEYTDVLPGGLAGMQLPHAPAVVFHTREDEWRRRARQIAAGCLRELDRFAHLFPALDAEGRDAFAREVAANADDFDAWAAATPRVIGRHVQRLHASVAPAPAPRTTSDRAGSRLVEFDAAVARRVRKALDITRDHRSTYREDGEPGIPAFRHAVFVVAESWRTLRPDDLADAIDEGVRHARAREAGALHVETGAWHPARGGELALDWSELRAGQSAG